MLSSAVSIRAVAQAVHHRDQRAGWDGFDEVKVTRLDLPCEGESRDPPVDHRRRLHAYLRRRHFFIVTVVPCPTTEITSNSSMRRFAPGKPRPSPPDVE